MTDDRRRFSRIPFRGSAVLESSAGRQEVQVLDISLKGVFLRFEGAAAPPDPAQPYRLVLDLSPKAQVTMDLRLAHLSGQTAGFACERIDIDSFTHLRRITEYNTADPDLLQRELMELVQE